jgi:hypothetical protein
LTHQTQQEAEVDIGASLFLLGLGAVFAFAVTLDLPGINIHAVGWILMLMGAIGLLVTFMYWRPRRAAAATSVVEERRVYADDPHQPPPPL